MNLERKWQHHEQNNFVMKECILDHLQFVVVAFYNNVSWEHQNLLLSRILNTCSGQAIGKNYLSPKIMWYLLHAADLAAIALIYCLTWKMAVRPQ